jgi:predicted TIM-barrel fold metal-dependent hydrolase
MAIDDLAERVGCDIRSVDDLLGAAESAVRQDLRAGALGFKMGVGPYGPADADAARSEFEHARKGDDEATPNLACMLFDRYMAVAAEADVPVAVHTGYWGDFRKLDPKLMLDFVFRHANVRFDLFHLGNPMIRDSILMGKSLPNVTLNLCWCYVISQMQTRRALDEIFDMVPMNKVIAFGADYRVSVQKAYGHLVMARETVAAALADRVDAGDISAARAVAIARQWFYDNPVRIYGLSGR